MMWMRVDEHRPIMGPCSCGSGRTLAALQSSGQLLSKESISLSLFILFIFLVGTAALTGLLCPSGFQPLSLYIDFILPPKQHQKQYKITDYETK